jgi:hypothetical protein
VRAGSAEFFCEKHREKTVKKTVKKSLILHQNRVI